MTILETIRDQAKLYRERHDRDPIFLVLTLARYNELSAQPYWSALRKVTPDRYECVCDLKIIIAPTGAATEPGSWVAGERDLQRVVMGTTQQQGAA